MTELKEIDINCKGLFDYYLTLFEPTVSDLTFTNLFMWRYYYRFKYIIYDNYLNILAFPAKDEPYALVPIGEKDEKKMKKAIMNLIEIMKENGIKPLFRKVGDEYIKFFSDVADDQSIIFDRGNSDYLYRTEDLINLPGKKYHAKRNHISKFNKLYKSEYEPINSSNISECYSIMEMWCRYRNCECSYGEYCEKHANMELLNNYEKLGCKGALIKVDGVYQAFTVGEMLNRDTAVIHIEKANFEIHGLYAVINQRFCMEQWKDTLYINREQDLDQEGLRKAKLSYHPIKLVEKYTVIPNK